MERDDHLILLTRIALWPLRTFSSASNWLCTWSARSRLAELVMLAGSLWYCFPVCLHGDGL